MPVARTRNEEIRTKSLRFFDSMSEKQVITGRQKWVINHFRHRRTSGANEAGISVHDMFTSRAQLAYFNPQNSRTAAF
jgi:hypothetical protein